jgi:hypothetical protein
MKRDFIERRIKKQREYIESLEEKIAALRIEQRARAAVIEELEIILKQLPRDTTPNGGRELRRGTDVYKAREALRSVGHPLHIKDLLESMGTVEPTRMQKRSLSSQLSAYANSGEIFTRPERATFGLLDFSVPEPSEAEKLMWLREQQDEEEAEQDRLVSSDDDIPF